MNASTQPKPPVVLYGALRSGTTLMRLILDGHREICCPDERDFMVDSLYAEDGKLKLDQEFLYEDRIFLSSGLTVPQVTDGKAAFDNLLAEDRSKTDKPHHVLVMHRRLRTMLRLYPDMRFIHLVRDPRDVAHSSIGMGWAGNTWFGIDHWIGTETEWDKHSPLIPPDQVFSLCYEDMLEAPEETLTHLCDFIGVPYDPAMLNFSETSTYAPIDPKLAYQWRRKQSEDEVADSEYKLADMLSARGYAPSVLPRRAPSLMRRVALTIQNKAFVWSFRVRRFGLVDVLLEVVTRRMGLKELGRGVRARIREKQKKYLK